jgi:hypothetical protein
MTASKETATFFIFHPLIRGNRTADLHIYEVAGKKDPAHFPAGIVLTHDFLLQRRDTNKRSEMANAGGTPNVAWFLL